MTTPEEIVERNEARERYVALIERWCHERDEDSSRRIDGLPWVTTTSKTVFARTPEVRSFF